MDEDAIIKAKDIDDCSNCPLYGNDCPGGWTSGGGGTPIEPPCCSWNGDEEIYEGMYNWEPSDDEIRWAKKEREKKEEASRLKREQDTKDEAIHQIKQWSKYGNCRVEDAGELLNWWYCPRCRNRFIDQGNWCDGLIIKAICPICHESLAHSNYL